MKEFLDIKEAAEFLSISVPALRKYKKEIGYYQRNRKLLFKKSDLLEWMEQSKVA